MARLDMLDEATMTPEQRAACTEAVAGPRGSVPAPMIAWLRSPALASRAAGLGEFLRFGTTLQPHLSEMAICSVPGTGPPITNGRRTNNWP